MEDKDNMEKIDGIPVENSDSADVQTDKEAKLAEDRLQHASIIEHLKNKLDGITNNPFMAQPKSVKRAIKALKKVQLSHITLEVGFFEEVHALEMKYEKLFEPLYERRRLIISGAVVPTDEECDFPSDSEKDTAEMNAESQNDTDKIKVEVDTENIGDVENTDEVENADVVGIPEFWLTAFKNVPTIADMIEEYDEPILKHLIDVRCNSIEKPMSFVLEFHFEPNEYFTNSVLTKVYELKCAADPSDVFAFEGPEIVKSRGCTIDWKKGKNVTVKTIKKKQKHKARGAVRTLTKTVHNDSFFNFFNPPAVPEEDQMDEESQTFLNTDFDVGNWIKDRVIPHAVLFYTGENLIDDDFDDEDDEEEEEFDEEDEEEEDEENDNQCLTRKKPSSHSQLANNQLQQPAECKQQ